MHINNMIYIPQITYTLYDNNILSANVDDNKPE